MRTGLGVSISASKPRSILGRPAALQLTFTHRLARALTLEIAADSPATVDIDGEVRTLVVPAGAGASLSLTATPRRLGSQTWPPLRARVAGPLGLAWWTRPLAAQFTMSVAPDLLRDDADRAGAAAVRHARAVAARRRRRGAAAARVSRRAIRSTSSTGRRRRAPIAWSAAISPKISISRSFSRSTPAAPARCAPASSIASVTTPISLRASPSTPSRTTIRSAWSCSRIGRWRRSLRAAASARSRGFARLLTAVQPAAAESNPLNAVLRIRPLVRHRSLVVMLTDLDDATVAGQLASAARLLLPKHLPLVAGLASPEAQALAHGQAGGWLASVRSAGCAGVLRASHEECRGAACVGSADAAGAAESDGARGVRGLRGVPDATQGVGRAEA